MMQTNLVNTYIAEANEIEIITIGVKCKSCGHTWGFQLKGQTDLSKLPFQFFLCGNCVKKAREKELENLKDGKQ